MTARWDQFFQDLRFAARTLTRNPGFASAAILTLGLGIGANTAIFSAIDETLFRPFPLPSAHQLVQVYGYDKRNANYRSSTYPDYEEFRGRARSFQSLAAYIRGALNVARGAHAERVAIEGVTGNYFDMLELPPLLGRSIRADDDREGAPLVAMLAESYWRTRFGADPGVLGQTLRVEGQRVTIIGVVPRKFSGTNLNWADPPQIWIGLRGFVAAVPGLAAQNIFRNRSIPWLLITGRLRPGVTVPLAQAELQTIAGALAGAEPATNRDVTAVAFELGRSRFWPAFRSQVTGSLTLFAIAAGLVLLLACANVSNLLLHRALGRSREFAVRFSLGAGRGRLVRQLLTETLLLAVPSVACALSVADGMEHVLIRFPNLLGIELALDLSLDVRVLWFCVAISLAAAVLFGLAPALQATRPTILPSLRESGRAYSGAGPHRLRHALVIVQVALSVMLLVQGGLFARSLLRGYSIELGFRPADLVMVSFSAPQFGSDEQLRQFRDRLSERLAHVPGVEFSALSLTPLLSPLHSIGQMANTAGGGDSGVPLNVDFVSSKFLQAAGIELIRGRDFAVNDSAATPRVAIVNQTLARRLWPGADVVGRTAWFRQGSRPATPVQVIGVAHDAKYLSVWEDSAPHLYLALSQSRAQATNWIGRTRVPPPVVEGVIRREWDQLAPGVPLVDVHTGEEQLSRSLGKQRAAATLFGGFAALATFLAAIGLYAVMAYSVAYRMREIGIRMALGARPREVARQILKRALSLAGGGVAAGALLSAGSMHLVVSQLEGVSPYDGFTFLVVAIFVMAVSSMAAWIPARRALRIDPAITLRCD